MSNEGPTRMKQKRKGKKKQIKEYEIEILRIQNSRLLVFKTDTSCPVKSPIAIPFGCVVEPKGYKFIVRTLRNRLKALVAIPKDSREGTPVIQILPAFKWNGAIYIKNIGRVKLEVWMIKSDLDRWRAMQIITRSHFLSFPASGLLLGCRFTDHTVQERIRELSKNEQNDLILDSWSEAWQEKPGRMIACAVLGTLFHGNPKGRIRIAEDVRATDLLQGTWHKKNRREVLEKLRVAWASRFAIDAPYRGRGIGQLLARKVVEVAALFRVPHAKFVEVMVTQPITKAKSLVESKRNHHDFLINAGYNIVLDPRPSKPLLIIDPETGELMHPVTCKKMYYYAKADML